MGRSSGPPLRILGGLLGHWSVWVKRAVDSGAFCLGKVVHPQSVALDRDDVGLGQQHAHPFSNGIVENPSKLSDEEFADEARRLLGRGSV